MKYESNMENCGLCIVHVFTTPPGGRFLTLSGDNKSSYVDNII